jgi:hypothetical protein
MRITEEQGGMAKSDLIEKALQVKRTPYFMQTNNGSTKSMMKTTGFAPLGPVRRLPWNSSKDGLDTKLYKQFRQNSRFNRTVNGYL